MKTSTAVVSTTLALGSAVVIGLLAGPASAAKNAIAASTYVPVGVSTQGAWLEDSTNHLIVLCSVQQANPTPTQLACIKAPLP